MAYGSNPSAIRAGWGDARGRAARGSPTAGRARRRCVRASDSAGRRGDRPSPSVVLAVLHQQLDRGTRILGRGDRSLEPLGRVRHALHGDDLLPGAMPAVNAGPFQRTSASLPAFATLTPIDHQKSATLPVPRPPRRVLREVALLLGRTRASSRRAPGRRAGGRRRRRGRGVRAATSPSRRAGSGSASRRRHRSGRSAARAAVVDAEERAREVVERARIAAAARGCSVSTSSQTSTISS